MKKPKKILDNGEVKSILIGLSYRLEQISDWDRDELETVLKQYAADEELKFGKIAPPLRAVLTGTSNSPGIYDVLYSLGRKQSLHRINYVVG